MKSLDEIAQALQGFDPQALSVNKAQEFIQHLVQTLPAIALEELPLMQALGRIVAEDIISPINVPAHDNSAMDGFAFDGAQLGTSPLKLRVVGKALAGKAWQGSVARGECVKIMTGAVMPLGLNTVIAQEFTTVNTSGIETIVEIPAGLLQIGDNQRKAGEDLQRGLPALTVGNTLTPAALGLVASLGVAKVKVYRQLRVAYFSTGDEVLSLGDAMREGAVYDSNRYTVFGLLSRMGCEVIDMGVVRDDPAALRQEAAERAAAQAGPIVNLASEEYFKAVDLKALQVPVVQCVFEEFKAGKYKIISFNAKRARGLMARYAVQKKISQPAGLLKFNLEGYAYDAAVSEPDRLVFRRKLAGA